MTNPPRAKGTKGENEVKQLLEDLIGRPFRRMHAGAAWDLETADGIGVSEYPIKILATRPDRGEWLFIMSPFDWNADMMQEAIRVEVKRRKTFAHHALFRREFS